MVLSNKKKATTIFGHLLRQISCMRRLGIQRISVQPPPPPPQPWDECEATENSQRGMQQERNKKLISGTCAIRTFLLCALMGCNTIQLR